MIKFLVAYPETLPLAMNVTMTTVFSFKGEWAKALYWLGAAILTVSLLMMKGKA